MGYELWIIWGFASAVLNAWGAYHLYKKVDKPDAKFTDKVFFVITFGLAVTIFSMLAAIII